LTKKKEAQFKVLLKVNKNRVSRQTLVNHLKQGVDDNILKRRESGKKEKLYNKLLDFAKDRLSYIPPDLTLV
jgi:hypothetical protein